MKKLLLLFLGILIYSCGNEESATAFQEKTIPTDTLQKVEQFLALRHKILKGKYDTLLYVYTPSVLSQEELMRLTESPAQYKIYKRFEEHLNEIIGKHGEVLLEFKQWKDSVSKSGKAPASEAGKFIKTEKLYFEKYFKVERQYKNWINAHKQGNKSFS